MGVCSATGGIFAEGYNVLGGIDKVVPVDVFVPGCPARPEAMIDGIVKAAELLEAKRLRPGNPSARQPLIIRTPAPAAAAAAAVTP
jgi:NADH-quinone oxidoreductase subunit B